MPKYIDTTNKIYTLTNDYLFKRIFRIEKYLKILLKKFFSLDVNKITYLNPDLIKEKIDEKAGIVDLLLETDDEIIILELQNVNEYNLKERMLYYLSSVLVHECIKVSEDYTKLKKCKMFVITNFNFLNNNILNEIKLKYDNTIFSDLIEYKVLELRKLKKAKDNDAYELGRLFIGQFNQSFKTEELKEIYEQILRFNKIEEERLEMGRFDYLDEFKGGGLLCAYNAGEESGEQKGIIKANKNIARKMLQNNLNIDLISKCTGINKKQILKLKQEINN